MTFGERLKQLRKERHTTLEEVGKYIGVGRSTILRYENNIITNIPSDKIAALARYFGVSPAYLMGWSENTPSVNRTIIVLDSDTFRAIVDYMTPTDYTTVMEIMEKTYKKMKLNGVSI